jgi:hypothetical protein
MQLIQVVPLKGLFPQVVLDTGMPEVTGRHGALLCENSMEVSSEGCVFDVILMASGADEKVSRLGELVPVQRVVDGTEFGTEADDVPWSSASYYRGKFRFHSFGI